MNKFTDEDILRFIDGELSQPESELIRDQIKKDHQLRSRYQKLKLIEDELTQSIQVEVSAGFTGQVIQKLDLAHQPQSIQSLFKQQHIQFALVICGVIVGLVALSWTSESPISVLGLEPKFLPDLTIFSQALHTLVQMEFLQSLVWIVIAVIALLFFDNFVLKPLFSGSRRNPILTL